MNWQHPPRRACGNIPSARVVRFSCRLSAGTIAILGALLVPKPNVAEAQAPLADCVHCAWSGYKGSQFPSTMCVFDYWGGSDCSQSGNSSYHTCETTGVCASSAMLEAEDDEAIRMVLGGAMLPGGGDYFFVVDGGEKLLMRKCDNSLVARLAATSAHIRAEGSASAVAGG